MNFNLAAVILNYNDADTTINLLSVLQNYDIIKHIVVVDNCSTDNSFAVLSNSKTLKVDVIKSNKNGGYGYGNNYGINYLKNAYNPTHILIANPDIQIEEDVIRKMLEVFQQDERVAVVAPFMLNRYGEKEPGTAWKLPSKYSYIFSADLFIGHFLRPTHYIGLEQSKDITKEVDCVAGSLLMVDTALMLKYGMYDENVFLFGEETTLGSKFKNAGLKTVLLLKESFLHLHGVSISRSISSQIKKRKLMLESRQYILKTYLGASRLELLLAKAVYRLSMFEYQILLRLRKNNA